MAKRRIKGGVKLIWQQMSGYCSNTEIFSVQKIKLDI